MHLPSCVDHAIMSHSGKDDGSYFESCCKFLCVCMCVCVCVYVCERLHPYMSVSIQVTDMNRLPSLWLKGNLNICEILMAPCQTHPNSCNVHDLVLFSTKHESRGGMCRRCWEGHLQEGPTFWDTTVRLRCELRQ